MLLAAATVSAQRVSLTFNNVSLSDALISLSKATPKYEISFIYDELEDFTVTTEIRNKTIPQAIQQLIGFYPVKATQNRKNEIFVECTQKSSTKLIGRLVAPDNTPIPYATILIANPADTAYITSGVSNMGGAFVIPCQQGDVLARISCIGYKTLYRRLHTGNVGTIRMSEETQQLNNITVRGKHPLVTHTENKTIFHTEEMLSSEGMTANDILKYLPRIIVRTDGTILYSGALATLYVNERKLDASETHAYLQSLNASDIERIELQQTRSSENSAQAPGGIISIFTKNKLGLDGTASMTGQKMANTDFVLHPSANAYFGTTRWNIYGAYDFRRDKFRSDTQIDYQDYNQKTKRKANSTDENTSDAIHNYKLGATALLDPLGKNTIEAEVNGNHLNLDERGTGLLTRENAINGEHRGFFVQRNRTSSSFLNSAVNYRRLLDNRDSYLRVLANYNYKHAKIDNFLSTDYSKKPSFNMYEYNMANSNTNNFSLCLDVRKNFANMWSLRWGAAYELSRRKHGQDRRYEDSQTSGTPIHEIYIEFIKGTSIITEPQAEWHWKVSEDIASAYAGFTRQWNNNLFLYASFRSEYSVVAGTDPQFRIHRYKHRRLDLIPYLYMSHKTPQRVTYAFTYTRSLIRPTFNQLTQYRIRRNDFIVDCGNTSLDCQTTDRIKLSADYGPHSLSATYSYSADAIIEDHVQHDGLDYRISTNNSIVSQWTLDYAYTSKPTTWWQTNCYVQGQYTYLPSSTNRTEQLSLLVSANNDFAMGRLGSIGIDLFANTPTIYGNAYIRGTWKADLSYKKSFLKDALTLKLSAQDIFNSLKTDIHVQKAELDYHIRQKNPTRAVVATLTWNFSNKQKVRSDQIENPNETKKRL